MDHGRITWQVRERLNWLAWLLDSSIPIPGTRLTIGLDALIGLFPVVGDAVSVVLSSYIVRLLNAWLDAPRAAQRSSRAFVAALVAGVAVFLVAACVAGFFIARWLWSWLGA